MNYPKKPTLNIIVKAIREFFPKTKAIVLYGSLTTHTRIGSPHDIDIAVILSKDSLKNTRLTKEKIVCIRKCFKLINLDVIVADEKMINKKKIVFLNQKHFFEPHGLIHYQIKHESRLLYGKKSTVDKISPISFDEALKDVIPFILNRINQIKEDLPNIDNFVDYIKLKENRYKKYGIFGMIRTLYSIKERKIIKKEKACEWLSQNYPEFHPISDVFKKIYQRKKVPKISKKLVKKFIEFGEKKFISYKNKK